jgi:hypothetical protein
MIMPIIVKKPFSFEDVKDKVIVKEHDTVDNVEQVHPEFEEKPVVESTTQSSEDVHGGSELTFSIDSSQSSGREQENSNTANNQADQNNTSSPNDADTNNDNTNANAADNNGDNKGAQDQQNAGGEKSNDNDTDKQSNDSGTNGTQEPQSTANGTNDQSAQEQENANAKNSGDNQDSEDGNGNNDTEDQGQESSNEGGENGDAEGSNEGGEDDGDTDDINAADNDVSNQEQENGDEDEESESEDTDDEQSQSGTYNTQQVVDVINGVSASSKYYQTEFWRFIEMIAEEKTRTFDPMGRDEYNVKKLMFRQFERKQLSHYKMSRVKEAVIILLDNSGSMRWWADNLQILADLAMQRNDVEVYLAPNGHIEEMLYPKYQLVNHDDVIKRLRNRKIIYVGDFDGADTPIILSWYNDVIWICPEERYIRFLEHNWVSYDESKFKGAFLRVFTLQELFNAFKKLLSTPTLKIWYDLCNETHECGGDEE